MDGVWLPAADFGPIDGRELRHSAPVSVSGCPDSNCKYIQFLARVKQGSPYFWQVGNMD
jgi:hypothetical protein